MSAQPVHVEPPARDGARTPAEASPRPQRLPRGRHNIPREDVERSQRIRLLEAMVRTVGAQGYAQTTMQDVLARAGVSRKTFYELFRDKEECFLEAYDAVVRRILHAVDRAYQAPGPWPLRVRRGLEVLLQFYAFEPELAKVVMVEVLAAGPEARRRYGTAVARFIPYLEDGRRTSRLREQLPGSICEATAGGIAAVIYARVDAGDAVRVPELLPDLVYAATVPFIGPARARTAAEDARRAHTA